jgi:hypothetical protein
VSGTNVTITETSAGVFSFAATDTNTIYTHPTHPGDDINIDTGALTGATVISDLDFNITTDTEGHVTDANATIATRELTAADIGAAATSHNHSAANITSGTLTVARGGTGAGTFTSGNVLVGAGTGAVTTLSRSGIDTRTTFPDADTLDGLHAVAFVRNLYSEFLDSSFPAAPLTTSFTSWSKPVGMPSVTLEANSRYYIFAAGSYYTAATTTGIGISPTFSTVSGNIRGGQIYINQSTLTSAGTSEVTANWRTMSTSGGQTGNFALATSGITSNPGNEFGFYGIVETSGNSTVLSMHIRSEVNGSAVNINRFTIVAMKLST